MQPTVKISGLPKQVAPATADKVPLVHGNETDYALLSDLITLFFNNIPSGVIPGLTTDYVISGGVWTGDSLAVNRNASMTAISVYLGQRTIAIGAVVARTFTASKDTYIDILNNLDGTGTLVYTEVSNNAASPALASNSIRIGIIVTGATTIAAAGSINQGQDEKVLPISASIAYAINDSLGNRICRRNANETRRGLATKGSLGDVIPAAYTTYLSVTAKTLGRSVEVQYGANLRDGSSGANRSGHVRVVVDSVNNGDITWLTNVSGGAESVHNIFSHTPSVAAHTYVLQVEADTGSASLLDQAYIRIEEP